MVAAIAATAVSGLSAQQAQGPEPWIHVEVNSDNGENMNLNLPLAAIEAAIALAPDTIVADGQLQLGSEHEVPVAAIRGVWQELRDVGDVEFATLQHEGNDVRIAREGETVLVDVNADAEEAVRVEVPVQVVDALLSGDGNMLNIRAAVEQLSTMRGEMVRVVEADNNIRVWIDESPTQ
tara:strand:- start:187 stop:723 length:537 start_codon:yes stop_codon:yes gene_type:complete